MSTLVTRSLRSTQLNAISERVCPRSRCNRVERGNLPQLFVCELFFAQEGPALADTAIRRNPLEVTVGQQPLCQRTKGDDAKSRVRCRLLQPVSSMCRSKME